jgi:lipopolysaccharide transport system permease protein
MTVLRQREQVISEVAWPSDEFLGNKINVAKTAEPADVTVVITPNKSWLSIEVADLWTHRDLLYFLIWRDLKVRYKQTALGIAWVVLQPLLMTLIFNIVLGRLIRVPSNNIPYALFAYSGLMLWTFFSGAISVTGNCLVANANLITKIYFPRLIIPIATVIARLVDLAVAFLILLPLMLYHRIAFGPSFLLTIPLILLLTLFAFGFGLWMSAVNVRYRDVGLALPVLIQLWMFVSPVVYPLSQVPEKWRLIYSMNPLVGVMENFRVALFGGNINWPSLGMSAGITLTLLLYGIYMFQSREKTFADLV